MVHLVCPSFTVLHNMQATLLSPEDSVDSFDDDCIPESLSRRDSLKLPMRAQSLNYPKSPRSPRVTSPTPGELPGTMFFKCCYVLVMFWRCSCY